MGARGWERLLDRWPWYRGASDFPVKPGSEFMAPLHVLRKPYGCWDPVPLDPADPWGWPVSEYEEALSLRPGLKDIARHLVKALAALARGDDDHGFADYKLSNNPYWPRELSGACLRHERFVLLLPLALSLAQDDKARVRWTLYGGSEQGPARPFWKGFYSAPGVERPEGEASDFFRRLLHLVFGETEARLRDLRAAGFRILPHGDESRPAWTKQYLYDSIDDVTYLLTFCPFRELPAAVRRAYLAEKLHLLPFPGSLLFWGVSGYAKLQTHLPFAMQIPLLHSLERHHGIHGVRIPQSGWIREPDGDGSAHRHGPFRDSIKRSSRHDRVARSDDDLVTAQEDTLAHVLFSTAPDDVGLYDKPMARNAQIWTQKFDLLLDGPAAGHDEICRAARAVEGGGTFGYRIITPAMRVGRHDVYWHRPLVAFRTPGGRTTTLLGAPTGYLTAYPADRPDLRRPVELWPRLLRCDLHAENVDLFLDADEDPPLQTLLNVRKIVQSWEMFGGEPLPRSFARHLLTLDKRKSLDDWLRALPRRAKDFKRGRRLAAEVEKLLERNANHPSPTPPRSGEGRSPQPEATDPVAPLPTSGRGRGRGNGPDAAASLTFDQTAARAFEVAYWTAIADLSTGAFANKNNADCVLDLPTQKALRHPARDLDPLGDYLLARHRRLIDEHGMNGKAVAGDLPFRWETDLHYPWMGGWKDNQSGALRERNLLVLIPGRDRSRAVILADHYDTAYMADHYEKEQGGTGARLATPGADDNCSATAALLMAAPVFLDMSRAGRLGCDVWLLHLTGEEYPAEGLGTCHLCRELVEGALRLRLADGGWRDLSTAQIRGLYVMDMIAHNSRSGRDVFQISPGASRESLWLAYQAHEANRVWNESVDGWNKRRPGAGRFRRQRHGRAVPAVSPHPRLHGEVRPTYDPRSTLYNTDGQMFSDVGVPVVLFMENYDISRSGYHDSKDTLANIDLDYGAALAAIAIEATARAATAK